MPILANPKHERFAQAVAAGENATDAYCTAGYTRNRQAASRLMTNVDVRARVSEIQNKAAVQTEITIASLTAMYLKDREFAYEKGQPGPAIRAADSLAKLHGFLIERQQTSNVVYSISDQPLTMEEWEAEHSRPDDTPTEH